MREIALESIASLTNLAVLVSLVVGLVAGNLVKPYYSLRKDREERERESQRRELDARFVEIRFEHWKYIHGAGEPTFSSPAEAEWNGQDWDGPIMSFQVTVHNGSTSRIRGVHAGIRWRDPASLKAEREGTPLGFQLAPGGDETITVCIDVDWGWDPQEFDEIWMDRLDYWVRFEDEYGDSWRYQISPDRKHEEWSKS